MSDMIDGIAYASTTNVYDTLGYGVVTQILYFDQNGKQVADRSVFFNLGPASDYGVGGKTVNSDGTFSFTIIQPGGGGVPNPYTVESFSSAGILTREDVFTPIYITSPIGSFEGIAGYTDSYTLFNSTGAGSSGVINGSHYDTLETLYDTSGRAIEKEYVNDLNDTATVIGKQILVPPNPILAVPAAATATAGTALALKDISLADSWASLEAGTLALNIGVDSGTVSGTDSSGHAFTASPGMAAHLTGTLIQINRDLTGLSFTGQAGTAHIFFQIYDQAGVQSSAQEMVTVAKASAAGASTPDPVLTGITQLSIAAGTPFVLNGVSFSDPWAAGHAGTLALNITTSLGTLSDTGGNVTGNGTAALHAVGTVEQIEYDLAGLILTSSRTGTANVQISVYDQAGIEATHLIGVTLHAA